MLYPGRSSLGLSKVRGALIEVVFLQDGFFVQKLVSPLTEQGHKMTLKDLLEQFRSEGSGPVSCLIHGISLGERERGGSETRFT